MDTTCLCNVHAAVLYCGTDGPPAGVPGNVTGPRGCLSAPRLRKASVPNYLAMQHIIQSSGIQTSAQSGHPSERFLPSQQILVAVVVGSRRGKASQVLTEVVFVCVCVARESLDFHWV